MQSKKGIMGCADVSAQLFSVSQENIFQGWVMSNETYKDNFLLRLNVVVYLLSGLLGYCWFVSFYSCLKV